MNWFIVEGEVFELDIDFVFVVLVNCVEGVILFMCEVVKEVGCLYDFYSVREI